MPSRLMLHLSVVRCSGNQKFRCSGWIGRIGQIGRIGRINLNIEHRAPKTSSSFSIIADCGGNPCVVGGHSGFKWDEQWKERTGVPVKPGGNQGLEGRKRSGVDLEALPSG